MPIPKKVKVIGLTGTLGAGKGTVRDVLKRALKADCITLSSIIKGRLGLLESRKDLQDAGNELRKRYGPHILVEWATQKMGNRVLILDGIRNPAEVLYLRERFGMGFFLLAIDAPPNVRFERLRKRAKPSDPSTWQEFVEMDERDQGKDEPAWGQQTKACMQMADHLLLNDKGIEELERKVKAIMAKA